MARSAAPPRTGGSSTAPSKGLSPPAVLSRGSPSRPTSFSSHRAHGASQTSPSASRSPSQSRKAGPYRSQKRPRHPGRHHPGTVGEIISEWWATSNRNGGRDHSGIVGDIERNQLVHTQRSVSSLFPLLHDAVP